MNWRQLLRWLIPNRPSQLDAPAGDPDHAEHERILDEADARADTVMRESARLGPDLAARMRSLQFEVDNIARRIHAA